MDEALERLRAEADVMQAERRADGALIAATREMTCFRLTISHSGHPGTWDEGWDYPPAMYDEGSLGRALLHAAFDWQHLLAGEEPQHWYRHRPSNRRRPNGDASREEIRA